MRFKTRWTPLLLAGGLLSAGAAWADDNTLGTKTDPYSGSDLSLESPTDKVNQDMSGDINKEISQAPGTAADVAPMTTAEAQEVTRGVFASPFTLTPRLGTVGFGDSRGDYTSRALYGFSMNFGNILPPAAGGAKIGIETGFLFAHVGSPGSNFFGSDSPTDVFGGSNTFLIPLQVTAGYAPSDKFLATLGFGADMIYRSIGRSMTLGYGGDSHFDSATDFAPSVGLNLAYQLSPIVALSLRGDYIPVPADDLFTATLGAMIPLA